MDILNLICIMRLSKFKIKKLKQLNMMFSSTNVINTIEVIFTIHQTMKETFLNNLVNSLSNFYVSTVYQAQNTMEGSVQIVTNLAILKSLAAQTKLTARIAVRSMSISKIEQLKWFMPTTHRSTNLKSMAMKRSQVLLSQTNFI